MIEIEKISLDKGVAVGVRIELPKAPLLFVRCDKGFAMCGYLNIQSVDKLGDAAFMVTGVRTFEDFLNANVKSVSRKAKELGIKENMKCREALNLLF